MTSLIDQIAAQGIDYLRGASATVTAVGPSGRTVDLLVSGAYIPSIPCGAAYTSPTEGDTVWVVKLGSAWHVAYSLGAPVSAGPQNLAPNASFEIADVGADNNPLSWISGWALNGATVPHGITASSHSGTRAWYCNVVPGAQNFMATVYALPVMPNTQYRLGAWVKPSAPMNADERFRVELWGGPDQDGANPNNTTDKLRPVDVARTSATWGYYEATITTTAATQWARIGLGMYAMAATTARGVVLTVDDIVLRLV